MGETVVSVSKLSKAYALYDRSSDRLRELISPTRHRYRKEFWALRDVTFDVKAGSTVGLVGANGAGKSTTLKILAGRLRQTSGEVEVKGRVSAILELGTGLQPTLTGRQNARINGLFMGLDPWKIEAELDRVLEFAGLGEHADQPLGTYSSGMKARLAFSVLTAVDPEVLILDEALATGDAEFSTKCTRFIRQLCRSGCTTIVVSHDIPFLAEVCDELVWLEDGSVREIGDPVSICTRYLSAQGAVGFGPQRPKHAVFRVDDPHETGAEFALQGLEWVAADGSWIAYPHVGDEAAFSALLEAGAEVGLSAAGAGAGWGDAIPGPTPHHGYRALAPHRAGGSMLFAVPVPQAPKAAPSALFLCGKQELEKPLRISAWVDGEFQVLGEFGTPVEGATDFQESIRSPKFAAPWLADPGA